jgi:MerR family transcriptional regulator, thiopeptide resistance regulator
MTYTVKKLAAVSGVSVRTLHFYDEIGLLKPAFVGANGYRYYQEEQLFLLQQILFYRELEFELKEIQRILTRGGFNQLEALKKHRALLVRKSRRTVELIQTIDKTIEQLNGGRKMKAKDLFVGFDPKKQAEHEEYLVQRFGESARKGIERSKRKVQKWSRADWESIGEEWDAICNDLVELIKRREPADSAEAQKVIGRHFKWLKHFWLPNRDSYSGHGQFIVESELSKAYEKYHSDLPAYIAKGITVFAESTLS